MTKKDAARLKDMCEAAIDDALENNYDAEVVMSDDRAFVVLVLKDSANNDFHLLKQVLADMVGSVSP